MTENEIKIKNILARKLKYLSSLPENTCRAQLAELRRGVGRIPGDIPALWGMIFTDLPEEFYSKNSDPSAAEWAIYLALTMFACHQQGHDFKTEWMYAEGIRFGTAVRKLAPMNEDTDEDLKRIRNRFNRIITAADMPELAHHLHSMVSLLRGNAIPLDYTDLAIDLYRYHFHAARAGVRLKWGQDFCRAIDTNKNNEQE